MLVVDVEGRTSVTVDIGDIFKDTVEDTDGDKDMVRKVEPGGDPPEVLLVPEEDVSEVLLLTDCDMVGDEAEELPVTDTDAEGDKVVALGVTEEDTEAEMAVELGLADAETVTDSPVALVVGYTATDVERIVELVLADPEADIANEVGDDICVIPLLPAGIEELWETLVDPVDDPN